MKLRALLLVVFLSQLVGCMTIISKTADESKANGGLGVVYAGTRNNMSIFGWYVNCVYEQPVYLVLSPLMIPVAIDVPLSIVADTAILPIDLAQYRSSNVNNEHDKRTNNENQDKKCHFHI